MTVPSFVRRNCVLLALLVAVFPLLAGIALLGAAEAHAAPTFRRIALIVGANDGGSGRTKLRYAHSDARAFAKVLLQLGGVKQRAGSTSSLQLLTQSVAALQSFPSTQAAQEPPQSISDSSPSSMPF